MKPKLALWIVFFVVSAVWYTLDPAAHTQLRISGSAPETIAVAQQMPKSEKILADARSRAP
jgi:hypothetical protein